MISFVNFSATKQPLLLGRAPISIKLTYASSGGENLLKRKASDGSSIGGFPQPPPPPLPPPESDEDRDEMAPPPPPEPHTKGEARDNEEKPPSAKMPRVIAMEAKVPTGQASTEPPEASVHEEVPGVSAQHEPWPVLPIPQAPPQLKCGHSSEDLHVYHRLLHEVSPIIRMS